MAVLDDVVGSTLTNRLISLENVLDSDILTYYGPLNDGIEKPFMELIEGLVTDEKKRETLSIILTTNGGSAFAVERMVTIIRHNYKEVNFIIPDYAYSAGTIFCMSGDNIYMNYSSVLGPIDPQVKNKDDKWVPAMGYLDKIKELLDKAQSGTISQAEFLILKEIDLAEIRTYEQARDLTIDLLKDWLVKYKFKNWDIHKTSKREVTIEEKRLRAEEIAKELGNNKHWLSHSRPISVERLRELKLKIEDYSTDKELKDKISSYYHFLSDYIQKYQLKIMIQTRKGVLR